MNGLDLHTLTGAYAIDALDAGERAAFVGHLAGCESCAQEVTGLRATAAMLGLAVAAPPDEQFRRRLMSQVRSTRQELPLTRSGAATAGTLRRGTRTTSRLSLGLAAALVVLAGSLGAVAMNQQQRMQSMQQAASEVASVLAAPDARTVTATGEQGSSARAIVSAAKGSAVFVGQTLPDVGAGHALQLWVLGDGLPRSVGVLSPGTAIVAHDVKPGLRLGVTVEPAGGSRQPTTSPIMQLDLA